MSAIELGSRFPSRRRLRTTSGSLLVQCALLLLACSSGSNSDTGSTQGMAGAGGDTGASGASTVGNAGTANGGTSGEAGSAGTHQGGTGGGGTGGDVIGGSAGNAGASGDANASGGTTDMDASSGDAGLKPFALTSDEFKEGEQIPLKYKCAEVPPAGQNISPPLSWGPGPAGTLSYAIVLMHVPSPEHWVIWDIPKNVTSLPEDIKHQSEPPTPDGSKQSTVNLDGFNGTGYLGPCPQAPNSTQSYQFTLYALDVATLPGLTATSTPAEAAAVVRAHLVAGSEGVSLTGTQIQIP